MSQKQLAIKALERSGHTCKKVLMHIYQANSDVMKVYQTDTPGAQHKTWSGQ